MRKFRFILNFLLTESANTMAKTIELKSERRRISYEKRDWLIMGILTFVYAITAFLNLGSYTSPHNGFEIVNPDEEVIFDMGKSYSIDRINLFTGLVDRRSSDSAVLRELTFSYSGDGIEFRDEHTLEVDGVLRWHGFYTNQEAQYVKVTFDDANFTINEMVFFTPQGDLIVPVSVTSQSAGSTRLYDEQHLAMYVYSWYDSTYFDEIYHPRTALEYIQGITPYENTHPPLGKLIIALGMTLLGVTPFGWRFFGCLAGVLMVSAVYCLSKQILRRTKWAAVSCALFTFDFMHLTQTRLATIDSFVTLFVILSFLYMFRYVNMNFYNTGVKKTLLPLGLSGLFFGLACAVKWQGLYAGIGLAAMYAVTLIRRIIEYRAARQGRLEDAKSLVLRKFAPYTLQTIAAGVGFFVIIPFAIYFASYIPIMKYEGVGYFWQNQLDMFNYHTQLTATHPYGSAWWQWLFDYKPLYAYGPNRDFIAAGDTQGIASFGNPLIWWATIPALVYLAVRVIRGKGDNSTMCILCGFLAMYLPWVIIPRQAFIYHFFPCVPFVCVAIAYILEKLVKEMKFPKKIVEVYVIAVIALYFIYYPVISGMIVPQWYTDVLSIIPGWVLG